MIRQTNAMEFPRQFRVIAIPDATHNHEALRAEERRLQQLHREPSWRDAECPSCGSRKALWVAGGVSARDTWSCSRSGIVEAVVDEEATPSREVVLLQLDAATWSAALDGVSLRTRQNWADARAFALEVAGAAGARIYVEDGAGRRPLP
jgi:hypothetical protein